MSGSFGKRARALVAFTTGVVPFAAASAQTVVPECAFSVAPSKAAGVMGHLYTVDNDTKVQGLVQVMVNAGKIKPNNKLLLASPGATLRATYTWQIGGKISAYNLEVGSPYMVKPGQTGNPYNGTLTIEGLTENFEANTYSTRNWNSMVDSNAADKFGALKKDVTLLLAPVAGVSGTAYTFSFAKGDIGKAYKAAQPQLEALLKKANAGQCTPRREKSNNSSGSCFLTTVTCEAVGLDDDCWELRTLRRFRDDWLAGQADGMDDIAAYYAKAPAIAERLKSDPQALLRLYWTRIVPSALAAQLRMNKTARAIYSRGMRELAEG